MLAGVRICDTQYSDYSKDYVLNLSVDLMRADGLRPYFRAEPATTGHRGAITVHVDLSKESPWTFSRPVASAPVTSDIVASWLCWS